MDAIGTRYQRFKNPYLLLLIIFTSLLFVSIFFGDRGWYEPDGVAILAGSVNLAQGKRGIFFLHGYYVQPLAYEINHLTYQLSGKGLLLYLLPAICGSLGISLLTLTLYFFSHKRVGIVASFCILLLFPELFLRLLYPNASVFAMMFLCLSLLLLFTPSGYIKNSILENGRIFFIGAFAALACLCRIEFCFVLPLLFYLVGMRIKSLPALVICFLGLGIIFASAALVGIFNPFEIIQYHVFHRAHFKLLNWSRAMSFAVFYSITNLIIWLVIAGYGCYQLVRVIKAKRWSLLLAAIPILFLFYPLRGGLTSAHYLLPAVCFAPFILVRAGEQMSAKVWQDKFKITLRRYIQALVVISLFLQFFSIEAYGKFPFIHIRKNPSFVYTHDGSRYLGAYINGYLDLFSAQYSLPWKGMLGVSHELAKVIVNAPSDFMVVGSKEREKNYLLGLTTYALPFFLQLEGYTLEYTKEAMILQGKNNKVIVKNLPYAEYSQIEFQDLPNSMVLIKIPLIWRKSPEFSDQLRLFYQSFSNLVI